jgi:hypothetical protein
VLGSNRFTRSAGSDGSQEAVRPIETRVRLIPIDSAQIVNHVSAAHDEHAPLSERRQFGAEFEMVRKWLQGIDRQFDNISFREGACTSTD